MPQWPKRASNAASSTSLPTLPTCSQRVSGLQVLEDRAVAVRLRDGTYIHSAICGLHCASLPLRPGQLCTTQGYCSPAGILQQLEAKLGDLG